MQLIHKVMLKIYWFLLIIWKLLNKECNELIISLFIKVVKLNYIIKTWSFIMLWNSYIINPNISYDQNAEEVLCYYFIDIDGDTIIRLFQPNCVFAGIIVISIHLNVKPKNLIRRSVSYEERIIKVGIFRLVNWYCNEISSLCLYRNCRQGKRTI